MTRTCSQRSEDDEVDEDLDEPEDDCATTPKGASNKRAVAARADLAKRLREQLDITSLRLDILRLRLDMKRCLPAGGGPALGDRYESVGKKVS